MKTKRKVDKAEQQHQIRCQFNSGYHDAALTVAQGWNTPERNFGFGPAIKITCAEDVLTPALQQGLCAGLGGWLRRRHGM